VLADAYGITFGACKATEGETFHDSEFPANWAELGELAANIPFVRMAYHYGHPAKDPDQSAAVFLDYVHNLEPTDLLVLDLETGDGLSQVQVNAWAKAWAAALRALAPSHRPVLYTGHAYMENKTGLGLNGVYGAWWYPRYPSSLANEIIWPEQFNPTLPSPNAWGGPPDWWQFSSTFPSVEGVIDANVYQGTLAQLRAINQT
jgi:GH25 family lysozyme M1 (1,4-beta-N-acetylmuramidase)